MRLLVCVKLAPEDASAVFDENGSPLRDRSVLSFSPADQSAVELALTTKDQANAHVTLLSMGPEHTAALLTGLVARGADEAVLLADRAFAGADTLATAQTLAAAIRLLGPFEYILCGRRASDGETGQVGPALSTLLKIPVCPNVLKATLGANGAEGSRLTDDGEQVFHVAPPALLALCEWRYPLRLPGIAGLRRARGVPVRRMGAADLALDIALCGVAGSPTRVVKTVRQPFVLKHPLMAPNAQSMAARILEAAKEAHE